LKFEDLLMRLLLISDHDIYEHEWVSVDKKNLTTHGFLSYLMSIKWI